MVEVVLTAAFPVSAARAFAFITDPARWQAFFPGFIRLAQPERAPWGTRGDEVTVFARAAGARRALRMTLEERVPGQRVRFFMRQRGFPVVEHERIFLESESGACRVCFVARYQPRRGALAVVDRVLLAHLLSRSFRAVEVALRSVLV